MSTRYALPLSLLALTISIVFLILAVQTETAARRQINVLAQEIGQLKTIRRSIQSQIKSTVAGLSATQHRAVATPAQQHIAAEKAELILHNAISKGILTRNDVLHMRRLKLAVGGGPDFDTLTRQIFHALNNKRLVAEDPTLIVP